MTRTFDAGANKETPELLLPVDIPPAKTLSGHLDIRKISRQFLVHVCPTNGEDFLLLLLLF